MKPQIIQTAPNRWNIRPQIGGERHRHTITAATRREARKAADAITAETLHNSLKSDDVPVLELLKAYKRLSGANLVGATLKAKTAAKNANSLLLIMRRGGLPKTARLSELTPETVKVWRLYEYAHAGLNFNQPNPQKNASLNATWRHARSVFSARALEYYGLLRIRLPKTLSAFYKTGNLEPSAHLEFTPISKDTDAQIKTLVAAALEGAEGVGIPPKEVAAMVEMARYGGMTLREMLYFRPDWVIETQSGTYINVTDTGGFTTKRGTKNRKIPVEPNRVKRWLAALEGVRLGNPDAPEASDTYKTTCLWLNQFLPKRTKKLHELRKMACSEMLLRTGDIFLASKFIGNSVATTVKYYAGLLADLKPL